MNVHSPLLSRRSLLAASLAVLPLQHAFAQATAKLIVPAAAGGTTDLLSRLYAQWLSEEWGRTVVAENRPGAGGVIASQFVAKSPADGNTLMLAAPSHVTNSGMMENVPYDPIKDFTPIAKLLTFGSVLVIHPSIPAQDLKQFLAYAKANPGKLTWALGATGTSQHLAGVMLAKQAGLSWVTVPYKGGGPAMNDLLGGHASFMIESIPTAAQHIAAGRIRALGVTGGKRSTGLPNVPTIAEAGMPGFSVEAWFALVGPAGLPPEFVQATYQRLQKIMAQPAVTEKLLSMGAAPDLRNPQETKAFIEGESRHWLPIIKEAGIKV
jgi:tripartite-type tricarboxylate transporter receptor subunit TctC